MPKFLRHWTVRVVAVYASLFVVSVLTLLGFVYGVTIGLIDRQLNDTIVTEISSLSDGYREHGLNGLIEQINERIAADRVGSGIYLLTDGDFTRVAGNLPAWPSDAEREGRWATFRLPMAESEEEQQTLDAVRARAMSFLLTEGYHLLVGRTLVERESFEKLIFQALLWAMAAAAFLALVGGVVMGRDMRSRLEGINRTTRQIILGDLQQRVPVSGSGDEFDGLAKNLNAMLTQIDQLMRAGREVTDNIAHDLRSPLTRLKTRLEVTLMSHDPPQMQGALEKTVSELDNVLHTFNAILSISQAEAGAGRQEMTDLDLADLVTDIADLYQAVAEDKAIALSIERSQPTRLRGNRHLLFQALANLVDNAIKYSPSGGRVTLAVAPQRDGGSVVVADTGPGIPTEEREHVLHRFVRLEQSRTTPGNGLGLSLVSAVAGLHNGSLILGDNHPGLRAELILGLPAQEIAPKSLASA
jgi:signal transduction histidine kinase